jgi:hypothetical protein
MADNVTIPATGSGTATPVIAADDIAGVQYQRVKIGLGADGAATDALGGAGAVAAGVQRTTLASDDPAVAALQIMDDWDNAASDGASISGDVAHDGVDAGEPVKVGHTAIAFGANPSAVAAADRTNSYATRHGVPFVIGGHMNAKSATYLWTASTTDDNVLPAIGSGTKYAITRITITIDEVTTVGVAVRLGFGTANVPALPAANADAVDDILVYHPGMVPGSGIQLGDGSGIIGVGADGAELRITAEATTSGTGVVTVTYFTIES